MSCRSEVSGAQGRKPGRGQICGEPGQKVTNGARAPPGQVVHTYSTFGRGIEEFHNGYQYPDLTALGRQEAWEEPEGRAVPLGLQVGGPAMRLPDEYETRRPASAARPGPVTTRILGAVSGRG